MKCKKTMYELAKGRARKEIIVTKNGYIGKGITIEQYLKLFVGEGFTGNRAMIWAKEWMRSGFLVDGYDAETSETVFLFCMLNDRETKHVNSIINSEINKGKDLWGRLQPAHEITVNQGSNSGEWGNAFHA